MRAAYYEKNGSAREVLRVGDVATPQAGPGEVRDRQPASEALIASDRVPNAAKAGASGCGWADSSAQQIVLDARICG